MLLLLKDSTQPILEGIEPFILKVALLASAACAVIRWILFDLFSAYVDIRRKFRSEVKEAEQAMQAIEETSDVKASE